MKKTLLGERKLAETVGKLRDNSFTVLDFMTAFKRLFPDEWQTLVGRFGLRGGKRRYAVATCLANRLYIYSHKSEACLVPSRKYGSGGTGDYRRAVKEERKAFGSPWIAVYRKDKKKVDLA